MEYQHTMDSSNRTTDFNNQLTMYQHLETNLTQPIATQIWEIQQTKATKAITLKEVLSWDNYKETLPKKIATTKAKDIDEAILLLYSYKMISYIEFNVNNKFN